MGNANYLSVPELRSRLSIALSRMPGGAPVPGSRVYGVPRGGRIAALILCQHHELVDDPGEADYILDDIVDSGATRERYLTRYPGKPFVALVDKRAGAADAGLGWVVFPWEVCKGEGSHEGAEDNVTRLLQYIGEDPSREGLAETPKRFVKALAELTSGLGEDPAAHLEKSFPITDADPGAGIYDQIILSRDVPFVSLCEHHLLPFDGVAHMAYLPGEAEGARIVGLSKLARCLDGFARRPQVQERLTMQVANAIESVLRPRGCAVVVKARHTCQCFRGVRKDGRMVTSAVHGVFRDAAAREELFALISL